MTPHFAATLATGISLLVASISLMFWQILSAPDRPNYPTSGSVKRLMMFWFAAALLYRAAEILFAAYAAVPEYVTAGQLASAVLLAGLMVTFLVDHLRNWLPAHTHLRIRRLLSIARCHPTRALVEARSAAMAASTGGPCPSAAVVGPALVELSLSGAHVAGPNASPDQIT